MRVVTDTNIVVSGLLWLGPPRQILEASRAGKVSLFTSTTLLAELHDVLGREKLARRLLEANVQIDELVLGYAALASVIRPADIGAVISDDPDDDAVLACAVAAKADFIVSGDRHLLALGEFRAIRILTASEFLNRLTGEEAADE
jgi:putative PIN family toxin of toxin-antitoxin system